MLSEGLLLLEKLETSSVLILVVMEYALGEIEVCGKKPGGGSLNPCCNGICSRSPGFLF